MPAAVRRRETCRLCDARDLTLVLSLGETPLANAFVRPEQRGQPQPRFPLDVHVCLACGHAQLLDVVDPELLFRDYVYVSATSPVFVEHFRRYAETMRATARLSRGSTVIEIGSNDGTMLRCFQDAGMRVLGIDPARAIAAAATAGGIETRPVFFDAALARDLRRDGWEAALITANNVFAHADDLGGIADGVAHLLAPDGLFAFEVSYLLDVVDHVLFDTIYHEHLSYHTVKPLVGFFERHGLQLIEVQRVSPHGGSLRGIAQRRGGSRRVHPSVEAAIREETARGLHAPAAFRALAQRIGQIKIELTALLRERKAQGHRIAGFGAPAKATTLLYHFGIGPETLDYIVDDSPWKQGRYTPGHHIPVVPAAWLYDAAHRPDDVLVLAWNFAESILRAHQAFHASGGHFIIPLPQLEVR